MGMYSSRGIYCNTRERLLKSCLELQNGKNWVCVSMLLKRLSMLILKELAETKAEKKF